MPPPPLSIRVAVLALAVLGGAAAAPGAALPDPVLPGASDAFRRSRSELPERFLEYETSRFRVLSDASPRWTRAQIQRLEQTHHQFHRFLRRLDLSAAPLTHKLVCVLFRSRDDYQHFAATRDEVEDPWIAGYYAPHTDRVVFYHSDANPSVIAARARLAEMQGDIESIAADARAAARRGRRGRAAQLDDHRQRYEAHVRSESKRVDDFAEQVSIATTVHEAVHQLMFHHGVQSRRVRYPVWISEGLASAFETDETGVAFGPDHEYVPRRDAFRRLLAGGRLLSLHELLGLDGLDHADEDRVHVVYHQSYALVTWMSRYRRDELAVYLSRMREETGTPTASEHRRLFERAFGAIDALEHRWLRHERGRVSTDGGSR